MGGEGSRPSANGCVITWRRPASARARCARNGDHGEVCMGEVSVNGRSYRVPERPAAVICFDGCDPAYIERGIADGILPTIASFQKNAFYATAESVLPSFTNPNNASIVTGAPPAVHG